MIWQHLLKSPYHDSVWPNQVWIISQKDEICNARTLEEDTIKLLSLKIFEDNSVLYQHCFIIELRNRFTFYNVTEI